MSQFEIPKLFGKAYFKVTSLQNDVNGFQSTGIRSTNRHVFSDGDHLLSMVTNRP